MKYILIIIFTFSFGSLWAADAEPKKKSTRNSTTDKEEELFRQTIKEKQVKEQLIGSDQFKECQALADNDKTPVANKQKLVRDCMAKKIESFDEKQLEQLEKAMTIGIYDKNESTSTKSMKDYLNDRLSEAIYGEKVVADQKLKALKERKIADHKVFYDLYKEQIGKNTMLYVSQYCFENFGYKDNKNLVLNSQQVIPVLEEVDSTNKPGEYTLKNHTVYPIPAGATSEYPPAKIVDGKNIGTIWQDSDELQEYQVCSHEKITDCGDGRGTAEGYNEKYRTVSMLEQLKMAEFALGQASKEETIKNRYGFCALEVISNMCELYKCNNTYTKNSPQISDCKDRFDITVSREVPIKVDEEKLSEAVDSRGTIACNVMGELKRYRNMLKATQNVADMIEKDFKSRTTKGLADDVLGGSFKGVYRGEKGEHSKDKLTLISSKELTEKVKEIAGSEDTAEQLKTDCMEEDTDGNWVLKSDAESNEKCSDLISSVTKSSIEAIELEAEGKAELYLEKVNKLGNNEDQIKEFIKSNNLTDIMAHADFETLSPEILKEMITESYRTQKKSELDSIRQKFMKEAELSEETSDAEVALVKESIAKESLADIKQHKKRLETLFQYSNIVSAYLTMEGDDKGANTTGREIEAKNSLNDDTKEYTNYFGEGAESGSGNAAGFEYVKFLDSVISGENKTGESEDKP